MAAIRTIAHPEHTMSLPRVDPLEASIRVLLRIILVPLGLAFCCLLLGIDAIRKLLTTRWRKPRS